MWVFAYGSLMADGWEKRHDAQTRSLATLSGYSRVLDKASTVSRGSKKHPAPTLRIIPSASECHGVAFEFSDTKREEILRELTEREGKAFPLREMDVQLQDGRHVRALVPIYEGRQIIKTNSIREIALMAIKARGKRGDGISYVRDIARHLAEAGVKDAAIADVHAEMERLLKSMPVERTQ
ncbi:cation transport regulator ChaC [Bradyrhizobium ottawaense]|uniref:gamma-glutamylcyclotransferase n=1 Tax=Bradyrhizobium ottawaense TaxID=931866 RepID=UPI00351983FF